MSITENDVPLSETLNDPAERRGLVVDTGFDVEATLSGAGLIEDGSGSPAVEPGWVHPKLRPRKAPRIDFYAADRIISEVRKPWPNPPAEVKAAEDTLMAACERLRDATEHVLALGADKQVDDKARADAVIAAAEAGKPRPASKSTDWVAEASYRRTFHSKAHDDAQKAARAYTAAVSDSLSEWRASLADEIAPRRSEAAAAVKAAQKAASAWQARVNAVAAMDTESGKHPADWHRSTQRALIGEGMVGLSKAVQLLTSDDPVASGAYLLDGAPGSEMDPPIWVREALSRSSNQREFYALGEIEGREGFKITAFTPGEQRGRFGGSE